MVTPAKRLAYIRKWQAANRDKIRAQQRARLAASPELRATRAAWAANNRDKVLGYQRAAYAREAAKAWHSTKAFRYRYAHVLKGGEVPAPPTSGLCECCGEPPEGRVNNTAKLMFEHCHVTNTFRGWVCHWCNKMLADAKDSPARLRAGAAYLERHA
jgi:Recombination endonuclease VII